MKARDVLVKGYELGRLLMAWQQVRKNAGAAGIDQMTGEEFAQRDEHLLALIHDTLTSGHYRFQPARRVLSPKEGTSKRRKLGLPVVMDRIVGARMHSVLGRDRRSGLHGLPLSASAGEEASIRPYGIYRGW